MLKRARKEAPSPKGVNIPRAAPPEPGLANTANSLAKCPRLARKFPQLVGDPANGAEGQ